MAVLPGRIHKSLVQWWEQRSNVPAHEVCPLTRSAHSRGLLDVDDLVETTMTGEESAEMKKL